MELTPLFNAAAQGDGGQMPTDAGPDITSPGGGGSASAAIEQSTSPAPDFSPPPAHLPSKEFEYVRETPIPGPVDVREDMAAMIKLLEKGRAKPGLHFNLRPKRALEKAVHKEVEFDRERLIGAFRAAQPEPDDFCHQNDEDLEFDAISLL